LTVIVEPGGVATDFDSVTVTWASLLVFQPGAR
jgi:hypothetical protein